MGRERRERGAGTGWKKASGATRSSDQPAELYPSHKDKDRKIGLFFVHSQTPVIPWRGRPPPPPMPPARSGGRDEISREARRPMVVACFFRRFVQPRRTAMLAQVLACLCL